jgi:hypothetical protein
MFHLAAVDWAVVFQPGNMIFICVFGMATLIAVAGIVGGTIQNIKKHQRDVLLKRDMIAKGYGVDEIQRVISMKGGK